MRPLNALLPIAHSAQCPRAGRRIARGGGLEPVQSPPADAWSAALQSVMAKHRIPALQHRRSFRDGLFKSAKETGL